MTTVTEDVKLDFQDVLLMPKRSTLSSRAQVSVERHHKFKHNTKATYFGVPIVVSNMDTTGTMQMAKALFSYKISVALHKFYPANELIKFFKTPAGAYSFYTLGTTDSDLAKFNEVSSNLSQLDRICRVCIDVANGYSRKFVTFVERFREAHPDLVIMAGNVVTPDMVYDLLERGADIVKIGIGGGCLTGDSRILMSDGTYKNIVDVQQGDEVITMTGKPAKVRRSVMTGYKRVVKVRNAHFHSPLYLTPDHKCFVGDLSSVSDKSFAAGGYRKILSRPTKTGKSKLMWMSAGNLQNAVGLMPADISFNLPETFNYDLSEYFKHRFFSAGYKKELSSSYDVGYMFGTFLGDGHSHLDGNFSGRVEWYFHKDEVEVIEKTKQAVKSVTGKDVKIKNMTENDYVILTLHSKQWATLLNEFGKKANKHLPSKFMCKNKDYLLGIYDGLMDSDGSSDNGILRLTNTSKQIIELFQFISLVVFGGCANVNKPQLQSSWLVKGVNESFQTFVANTIEKRVVNGFQAIKLLEFGETSEIEVPVYDLEIDDDTHSFIANNMIVHNSVCTTRKLTGVGYPQLSAIIECADAAHGAGGMICSDGGIICPGDIAKAFAGGADFVMCGSLFAGHDECNGDVILKRNKDTAIKVNGMTYFRPHGPKVMQFYGMSSEKAMQKHYGEKASYRAGEGKVVEVPYKGPVAATAEEILGGLRSACTYVGAQHLKHLPKCATFVKVNRVLNTSLNKYDT